LYAYLACSLGFEMTFIGSGPPRNPIRGAKNAWRGRVLAQEPRNSLCRAYGAVDCGCWWSQPLQAGL